MDERTLRAFLTLAETLHFGRAAEACHMSPPTLTRTIRRLEQRVGSELFERDKRSVALTPAGGRFRDYARDALQRWEDMRASLPGESAELAGEISIYCSVTASYSFLYELLSDFRDRNPNIRLTLHTGDPEEALARVGAGREDLAIGARPERIPKALAFEPIAVSPLVFIAPAADPSIDSLLKPRMTADAWQALPMILPERGVARDGVDRWCRGKGIRPGVLAQVAGNEAIVSMVALGGGVGVVPEIVLGASPLQDRVRTLAARPALPSLEVGLFVQRKRLRDRVVGAFWAALAARRVSRKDGSRRARPA